MHNGKIVIYINHWFSSMARIIMDLKKKYEDKIFIIGSSHNNNATYKNIVDLFITEDEYLCACDRIEKFFCTCFEYKVDMFFFRDKHGDFSDETISKFKKIGTTVVLDINDTIEDKVAFYDELKKSDLDRVKLPEYISTRVLDERVSRDLLVKKLGDVDNGKDKLILKKALDEGGNSFREIISNKSINYDSLSYFSNNKLSVDDAFRLLNNLSKSEMDRLIFMEKLGSPEISIDCYNSKKGFIAVKREKRGRVQTLTDCSGERVYNDELAVYSREIAKHFNIKYPFNVQFMSDIVTGEPKLLEVNLRLSGGAYLLTTVGINIVEACMLDVCSIDGYNYNIHFNTGRQSEKVAYIEDATIL